MIKPVDRPTLPAALQVDRHGVLRDVSSEASRFATHMEEVRELIDNFQPEDSLLGQMRAEAKREASMPSPASVARLDAQRQEARLESISDDVLQGERAGIEAGVESGASIIETAPQLTPVTTPTTPSLPAQHPLAGSAQAGAPTLSVVTPPGPQAARLTDRKADVTSLQSPHLPASATPVEDVVIKGSRGLDTATGHVGDAVTTGLAPRDASQRPGATPQSASSAVQTAGGAPQAVSAAAPLPTQATAPKGSGLPAKPAAEPASAAAALADTQATSPPGGTVAQSAPGPVLTPAQIQARVIKRKALGLEGALAVKIQKQELAEDANRVAGLMQKDRVENAGPAVGTVAPQPVQPVQWSQPAAPTSNVVAAARPAASQDPVASPPVLAAAGASQAPLQAPTQLPREAKPVGAAIPSAMDHAASAASAMDVRSAPAIPATVHSAPPANSQVQPRQGTEPAPADLDPFEAALDAATAHSPEMPGAPPAPVRQQREERIAETIGAQLMAQQARIELVNVPELAEVIKKI